MTARSRRLLRLFVVLVVVPVVLGAVVLGLLLHTPAGARFLFERVGALTKGGVKVQSVEGRLSGPLRVRGLRYETESIHVDVETLDLDWHLSRLLHRQLDIESVVADGVVVVSKKTDEPAKGLSDVHLPVNIIVRGAVVKRLRMGEDPKNSLLVDSITLKTASVKDSLRIDELAIRSPLFDGDFKGTVTPLGEYPVSLDMKWAYRPPEGPAYAGEGSFRGSLAKLTVTEKLTTPFAAQVDAVFTEPFRELGLDVTARFTDLSTQAIDPKMEKVVLGGEVHATGRLDAVRVTARVSTVSDALKKADVALDATYEKGDWKLASLEVTRPGDAMRVHASGSVRLPKGQAPVLDLTAVWSAAHWPLDGKASVTSREGTAHVTGTPDAYELEVAADLAGESIPEGRWTLKGSGDKKSMRLASFGGATLRGRLEGSGDVGWSPEVAFDLAVRGRDLDPSAKWAGYEGRLSFDLTTKGRVGPKGPEAHVVLANGEGKLRGQDFSASGTVDVSPDVIRVSGLRVASGVSHLTATGVVGERSDLVLDVEAPNLAALSPDVQGSLTAHLRVTGPKAAPRVVGTLAGKALGSGERRLAALAGKLDVDLAKGGALDVRLRAEGVALGDRSLATAALELKGRRDRHVLTLATDGKASGKPETLAAEVAGGLDERERWSGTLRRLDLRSGMLGDWTLAGPARLEAASGRGSLADLCLLSGGGRLCAAGTWADGAFDASLKTEKLPLSLLSAWLPAGVSITGTLDGSAEAKGTSAGALTARVDLTPGPGDVRLPPQGGKRESVAYRDAVLHAVVDAAGLKATAGFLVADAGKVAVDVALPRFADRSLAQKDQPLEGRVIVDVPSLAIVEGFVSKVRDVKGSLHADLALSGTVGAPAVRGEAALAGGSLDVPDYGVKVREVALTASGDGTGPLTFSGSLRSGRGRIEISGQTPLSPGADLATTVKLTGEDFVVLDQPPDNKVLLSPRITLTMKGAEIAVEGDLEIPEAKLVYETTFATVKVSRDVVLVGAKTEPAVDETKKIRGRVRLVLGDRVKLTASGLDARLTGSVLAIEEPGKATVATGELSILDGTYKAYGQDLRIERGRLLFAGTPVDNPGIDARASRRADDGVVAGIVIKGTLRAPETTLYSIPPMAQADALAYLLLGHPLNQSSKEEGGLLANAAASLGLKGGNLLVKKLAARFGLDDAKIESKSGLSDAALVVGKYLTPRIYVQYGIGILTRASTLRVSYSLTKSWTVRAETGAANSGDILYTIER